MKRELEIKTLDLAKRLLDFGFHPPTVYFPLLVDEALMVEPTETETKETLDAFAEAIAAILREAAEDPEIARNAPYTTPVRRLDEVGAAAKHPLSARRSSPRRASRERRRPRRRRRRPAAAVRPARTPPRRRRPARSSGTSPRRGPGCAGRRPAARPAGHQHDVAALAAAQDLARRDDREMVEGLRERGGD